MVTQPTPETAAKNTAKTTQARSPMVKSPGDHFETATGKHGVNPSSLQSLGGERTGATDVMRLARDNPAQAKQLIATMKAQQGGTLARVKNELEGARMMLQQLGAEKFSKKSMKENGAKLRSIRERVSKLKLRANLAGRKMALLQQLAGKLGDPRLDEELERLLRNHDKLQTDWGKRHHLFSLAELLYCDLEDSPDHLREVVKANVRNGSGEEIGEALQQVSPRRVISELIARTLDGSMSAADSAPGDNLGQDGEYGSALQTWGALRNTMTQALSREPFNAKTVSSKGPQASDSTASDLGKKNNV